MNNLLLRRLGIVAAVLILGGAAFLANYFSNSDTPPQRSTGPTESARQVETIQINPSVVPTSLDVQGQLVAFDKIQIFAEVSGVLEESGRPFKVGSYFPKGSLLAKINAEEARLNLLSQKSSLLNSITQMMPDLKIDYPKSFENWQQYLNEFDPEEPIEELPEPVSDQEKYFVAAKNIYNQYYSIKSAETRLDKFKIFAPFSGVLTEANINPGTLVRVGQPLGQLMSTGAFELEATVPLADLNYLKVGNRVSLYSDDIPGQWNGQVQRISDQIDPSTQTVKVFIGVRGKNLREGMYLRGDVRSRQIEDAVKLPRDLLIEQNSIYIVRDTVLDLHRVEVVKITADSVVVKGLENGVEILKENIPGAFNGMPVRIRTANTGGSNAGQVSAAQ